jgi:hypothetical protein
LYAAKNFTWIGSQRHRSNCRLMGIDELSEEQRFTSPNVSAAANGYLYHQLQIQVRFVSFMDCLRLIAWLTLGSAGLLLLVQRFKPVGKAQAAQTRRLSCSPPEF